MNKIELWYLKQNLDLLLDGIDPESKIPFGEDSVLNSDYNREMLNKISKILEYLIKIGMVPSVDKRKKFDFYITETQKQLIEISEKPISISEFIYKVNEVIDTSNMKKLSATTVTKWLTDTGYLKITTNSNGMQFKVLTEKANKLGLICVEKTNKYGNKYNVNLYPSRAQKFILENLDGIVNNCGQEIIPNDK